ncbi:MAG: hypothetical protein EXR69_12290 [Myxococcales bacterium]|nr:hypothetical protein [Myxococcales bacterium]
MRPKLRAAPRRAPLPWAPLRWTVLGLVYAVVILGCAKAELYKQKAEQLAADAKRKATTPAMPCDADVSEEPPLSCVSGKLWCGATVEGTTLGGLHNWDGEFYNDKFCLPGGDYSGPERVYTLDVPEYTAATVELQSDCVDLDLVAVSFTWSSGACPGMQHNIPNCDGSSDAGGDSIELQSFANPGSYMIAVDGKGSETGTYRLTVRCAGIVRR